MHSKRRCQICISSVFLGEMWVFSKLQGLEYYFPENFRCNLTCYESETYSDFSLHCIFESQNFRFPFTQREIAWLGKWKAKSKLQNMVGNLLDKPSKIVHEWNGHLEIFSRPQYQKVLGDICFSEQIFHRKQSLGAPNKPLKPVITYIIPGLKSGRLR